jgi:hypothetical protein
MRGNFAVYRRQNPTLTKPTVEPHPNSPQLPSQVAEGFQGVKA